MMKHKLSKRVFSMLLALVTVVGLIPASVLTVHAGHTCPDCGEWIDGSPYCSECYLCDECVEMCYQCGKCTDCTGAEICDGCSDEESGNMCTDCSAEKGAHCPNCDTCYYIAESWCAECGSCESCTDICDDCSVNLGFGLLCWDCAEEKESHCPGCGGCYFATGLWCEECKLCSDCVANDEGCSVEFGAILCKECASERGNHCPECAQCYFDVGSWCEECGKCEDCSPACLYCCEETGTVICEECAIESEMHCPECSECYSGGEYCTECGVCAACADICSTDELCMDCAIAGGYHCPGCEACGDQAILCEGCGERCNECADAFCESCNLCDQCVLICQGCGSCEECATICPNCEEYCSECEGICDDCEFCLVCCADIADLAGCDCAGWVCVESNDWQDHFDETHTETDGSHSVRPVAAWEWDDTYHWHKCAYCDEPGHCTGKGEHSYDATGKCTTCYYVKNAKIQIVVQPKDEKYVCVTSAEEDYDESNIAYFSVKAIGNSELTYTWCRRTYVGGQLTYAPLTNPGPGECYTGPNLAILAPTDACCNEYYICCFITDEAGNEVKTEDALLTGRHDYHYYKQWRTHQRPYESAERNKYGHILKCVGETCEKVTRLLPHEDADRDGLCDVCDFEIGKILITKQPKDVSDVYVSSAVEDYTEINYAHFHVEAEGESELTYTWCRKQYVNGVLTYVPLRYPDSEECYDGPDATIQVPTDACCNEYTYACIITDEEGNETRTVDVLLKGRHHYQYYQQYLTHENPYPEAERKYHAHALVCVGEGCGKVTRYRKHEDADHDYFCDICDAQKDFTEIGLTVTAPKEGVLPSYTVTTDSVAYYAMGGSSNYTQYRFWFVSDNGVDNWQLIDKTTPFVAGKYYKFVVEMQTKTGYTFPTYNSEPSFWAKVNGDYVLPEKTYGMDPTRYVTVSYEFGICNDSVIENIVIENVTTPVAGEKPTYCAAVRGSGYYIDTGKNAYYDDWQHNRKLYYIKNGIGWFDMTEFDWVYENESFIPGHEYQVRVYLKTEEGYTFYHDKWMEMLFTASVNGFGAEGNTTTSAGLTEQTISASFSCEGKKISTVMVNGLSVPRAGETPDYTASAAYPEWYQLDPVYAGTNGIVWYDSEGYQMEPTDTFVEGKKYKVEIKIIPTQLEGSNTSKFVPPLAAYVNGKLVTADGEWDAVYSTANAVYIYYSFPKAAAPTGYTVSGTVTSLNDESDDITLQLIPQGLPEPAYETIVRGNTAEYCFAHVIPGTYTLRVSKEDHVTREFTVVVSGPVIQNVELSLKMLAAPVITKFENTAAGVKVTWGAVENAANYRLFVKTSKGWATVGTTAATSFTYTGAKSGQTYTFTVRCLNAEGTAFTSSYNASGWKQTYVAQPAISKFESTASGIKITWNAVSGAAKYRVFAKTSKGWLNIGTTTGTSFVYTGAKTGLTYTFTVRCLNAAGTAYTSSYNATGWRYTYSPTPVISKLESTASGIKITWNAVNGAAKYRVFAKTSKGWLNIGTTTGTSFVYTGAKTGLTYTFTVRCLNAAGTAYTSAYNTTGSPAPVMTKLENTSQGIKLAWGAINGAARYRVFVKTSKGWTAIGTTTGTSFTWTGAKSGYTYCFTVRCVNAANNAFTSSYNTSGWSIKRT